MKSKSRIGYRAWTRVLTYSLLLIIFLSPILLSAAIKKTYVKGDTLKVALKPGDYKVRIITPSHTIFQKVSRSFAYKLSEIGEYTVIVTGDEEKRIDLDVIEQKVQKKSNQSKIIQKNPNESAKKTFKKPKKKDPFAPEKFVRVGGKVTWRKKLNVSGKNIVLKIPKESEQISVTDGRYDVDFKVKESLTDKISNLFSSEKKKSLIVEEADGNLEVEYVTPGPKKEEIQKSPTEKEVVVYSNSHFTNVLASTKVPEELKMNQKDRIKIYWNEQGKYVDFEAKDTNQNGLIDEVEWVVPHLSTQSFKVIIEIVSAEHLDKNRNFLRDIFSLVSKLDHLFAFIPAGDYVRTVFETPLTSKNDITIYAMSKKPSRVAVYEKNSDKILAIFENISRYSKKRIQLWNLLGNQTTFDLKVLDGPGVYFDYIYDPTCTGTEYNYSSNTKPISHAGSWAVQIAGWRTASDTQAKAGKNPEDTATTTMSDFDLTTDGSNNKLKLKDKNSADGQWLKIDTGLAPGQIIDGDVFMRVVGADLKNPTQCGGKQTWTNFNNVIVYLYQNSTDVNTSVNITTPISTALFSDGCTVTTSACTVDSVDVNLTSLYNQAPAGQNFTVRVIADSGYGNNEIKEIVEVYMRYRIKELDPPNVSIISPPNNSVDTDGQVLFEYNVSDASTISNCSLIIDGSIDQTDTSITNGQVQNFSKGLSNGLHNWTVNCTDEFGNIGTGNETRIINISLPVDNQKPNVTSLSPSNASTVEAGTVTFVYNVTDNLAISNCSLIINGSIDQTDTSITENTNQSFTKSLLDTFLYWYINCTDNSAQANVGSSETRQLTVKDTSNPSITDRSPADLATSNVNDNTFYYNATDVSGIANCSLFINGTLNQTNTSVVSGAQSSFSQTLADGVWLWAIGCYDNSPQANYNLSTNYTLTVTTPYCLATDFNFTSNGHSIYHAGSWAVKVTGWRTADDSQATAGKNPEDTASTTLYDGDFETDGSNNKLKLKDKAANDGQWLKIDTGLTPGYILNGSMILRVVGADLNGVACKGKQTWADFTQAIAYLYNSSSTVDPSINATSSVASNLINPGCTTPTNLCTVDAIEINITDLYNNAPSGQNFTIRLIADSNFGNKEIPEIVEIYLQYQLAEDNTPPTVTLIAPPNNSVDTDGYVTFQYNVTDEASVSSCELILDGSVVDTDTSITKGTTLNFSRIVSDGIHNWSVNCTDINSNEGASQTWILNVSLPPDNTPPTVTLISPADGASLTDGTVTFQYNVTDNLAISSCELIINGTVKATDTSITEGVTQNFTKSLENGYYTWSVNCTDNSANANEGNSSTRTLNISAPIYTSGRFWESSTQSFTTAGNTINLSTSRDGTQNDATFNIASKSTSTMSSAESPTMSNNGALIGASSNVDLSGYFTAAVNNKGYITWKLYRVNGSSTSLICQSGNDGKGGTRITSATGTFTSTCTAPSTATRLYPYEKLRLVVNIYNDDKNTRQFGHAWDSTLLSFVDINNFKSLGFLDVDLVSPLTDPAPGVNDLFNITCQVRCKDGNCTNTKVYAQYNSGSGWSDIGSSGSLILDTGVSNPQNAGETSPTYANYTFQIKANSISSNTIRCRATSDYSNSTGATTTSVTVGGGANTPVVTLSSPANNYATNSSTITLIYNVSDADDNIKNATLILNGQPNQTNQTPVLNNQLNNFTITLADGVYNWTVNVSDTTGLVGTATQRNFTIDTQSPKITLHKPSPAQSFGSSSIVFNFTVTDNLDASLTCDLIIDSTIYENDFSATNNTPKNFTEIIGTGTHFWNVTCFDDAGNTNTSETRNFSVTDEPPKVALITANNSYSTTGNISLQFNATDNNWLVNATVILNGVPNKSNQTPVYNGNISYINLTNLAEGVYLWDINVTDSAGLTAINGTNYTFTIDKFAPQISLNLPSDNYATNISSLAFNFTVTDSVDSSLTCNLSIGSFTDLNFQATNNSLTNRDETNLPDGYNMLWNVTCSDDAGNSNTSISRTINITEYPTISLNTANNSYFNTSSINLTYTPSDNVNLSTCSLYLDGVFNQTNQSPVTNGAQNNFTVSGLSDGSHNWTVYCNDTFGLQNNSETRTFTIDTQAMTITLLYPTPSLEIFSDTVNFSYNATDNLDPLLDCNITVNGEVVDNYTATSGAITNRTVTFSSGGFKLWNVTCQDDASNVVTSVTQGFTLAFAPSVTLTSPADGYATNQSSLTFYYNASDDNDNIANSTLILDGVANQTNQTPVLNNQINNFTVTGLSEGVHTWNVNVTDNTSLTGSGTTRNFTVDFHTPQLVINFPLQGSVVDDNNVTLNFTVTDNLDSNLTCNVSVDAFNEFENIGAQNATDEVNYIIRNDGNYTWYVRCADDAGNINQSADINFSVVAPPKVSLQSPANRTYTNESSISFIYYPYDAVGITNCSIYLDGALNKTDTGVSKNQNNTFTISGISEGKHNWSVSCYDPDNNRGDSETWVFYRDLTAPNITLNSPPNASGVDANNENVYFNWTATDALDVILTCDLVVDGVTEINDYLVTSGVSVNRPVSGLSLGRHVWNVTCWDSVGNINTSQTWEFNRTYPDFSINSTDISFNETSPQENENVLINATIHNLGGVDVSGVIVRFYEGDPDNGGTQIGSDKNISINAYSSNTTSVVWNASIGPSQIFVIVDPPLSTNGSYTEHNESNNKASKNISVGGWNFLYGEIKSDSRLFLKDENSSRFIKWNKSDLSDINIYATDYDSQVSWLSVQAIGKNKTGSNTSNDFQEIDSALGMSSFQDSVSSLYLNGSTINETRNYLVFSRNITDVPVTTSINSSNFKTGILWDTSDDTNGEYDSTEKEDLIFVTSVNLNAQGSYGPADYEIRIPAKLREYITTSDQKAAALYTEIR